MRIISSMSGDSPDYDLYKKKEEESNLLVPERSKAPLATIASAGVAAAAVDLPPPDCVGTEPEEKQEFLKFEKDENKVTLLSPINCAQNMIAVLL